MFDGGVIEELTALYFRRAGGVDCQPGVVAVEE
jgi:hypothetical protein